MSEEIIGPERFFVDGPRSVLERTFVAEYLISIGYLVSDLEELAPKAARSLMREACQFAALRLDEIGARDKFPWEIGMPISLN